MSDEVTKQVIGKRLRKARENAGLTQATVAQRLRLNRENVTLWENGRQPVPAMRLDQLAKMYGRTIASLKEPECAG